MKKIKRISLLIISFVIIYSCVCTSKAATFDDINQNNVFLNQQGRSTCTLVSSAMMMRRAAILQGNSNWASITESSLKSSAWASGAGLKWSFSYAGISVGSAKLPTGNANKNILINLLAQHPEGIVLHYKGAPHAVLLTDYTDGTFYCSDPLPSRPTARIPLSRAYKVTIQNATRYWFVTSPQCYLSQEAKVAEPSGYTISMPNTLYTIKQNISVTIDPYDNNIDNYTFVIFKNGVHYTTINNGASKTLSYNIKEAGNYQVYGIIHNAGGTFSGAIDNGSLSFEISDQILSGFTISCDNDLSGFDASKGITLTINSSDSIEVDNYSLEIYRQNETTNEYDYLWSINNGSSNKYHFQEYAGKYKVKIILKNRVSGISGVYYLNAIAYNVSGVQITYDTSLFKSFVLGECDTMDLDAVISPETALNKNITWSSSNSDVVSINSNGTIKRGTSGFTLISVCTDDGNFISTLPIKLNPLGIIYGDINNDGQVDISDLVMLRKFLSNVSTPTEKQKEISDLDGDGVLSDNDIDLIRMYIQEISYIFPVESIVNNVSINSLPTKTHYYIGEDIDLTGLKLNVQYNSGQTEIHADNYSYTGNTDTAGKQKIVISYCEDEVVKTASFDIDVEKKTPEFSGTQLYTKTYGDDNFQLDTQLLDGDGKITYTSSDPSILEITDTGNATIKSTGSVVIKATSSETEHYKEGCYLVSINIDKANQKILGTNIYNKRINDDPFVLDTKLSIGNGQLTYNVVDDKIASIDSTGKVTIKAAGTTLIEVISTETTTFKENKITIILNVADITSDPLPASPIPSATPQPTNTPENSSSPTPIGEPTQSPVLTDAPNKTYIPNTTKAPEQTSQSLGSQQPYNTNAPNTIAPVVSSTPVITPTTHPIDHSDNITNTVDIQVAKASIKKIRSIKGKKIEISIKKIEDADGYQILYSTSSKMKTFKTLYTKKQNTKISNLKRGKRYYIKVRAYIKTDNGKIFGPMSNLKTIRIKK